MSAKKIDKVRVVKGRMIVVENQNRHPAANETYVTIQVEAANGKGEECLMFTKAAIAEARERAKKNPEDVTEKSFLTNLVD